MRQGIWWRVEHQPQQREFFGVVQTVQQGDGRREDSPNLVFHAMVAVHVRPLSRKTASCQALRRYDGLIEPARLYLKPRIPGNTLHHSATDISCISEIA